MVKFITYIHTSKNMYTHIHAYIHIHIYIHIHTHTCIQGKKIDGYPLFVSS